MKLCHLYWREEPDVLEGMWFPTAISLNGKIFVGDRFTYHQFLCVFNVGVSPKLVQLPFHDSCELSGYTLATIDSKGTHIRWYLEKGWESRRVFKKSV